MAWLAKDNLDVIEARIVAGDYGHVDSPYRMSFFDDNDVSHIESDDVLLHDAVKFDKQVVVEYLLDEQQDINKRNKERSTCLHIAAKEGLLDMVRYLTARGAIINSRDVRSALPMHEAARSGYRDIVAFFLDQGIGIDETDQHNWTALHHSAYGGHLDIVNYLVESGADIDAKTKPELCEEDIIRSFFRDEPLWERCKNFYFCETPVHLAARSGHLDVVKCLVYCGADVRPHHDVLPVINVAASYGRKEVVQFFITEEMNINETDVFDRTPLHCAVLSNNLDTVKYVAHSPGQKVLDFLISKSSEIINVPLQRDIEEPAVLEILRKLDNKVKVDLLEYFGHIPVALIKSHLEAIDSLLETATVDLDAQDNAGYTPLHLACMNEHITSVNCLLESGAKPDVKDNKGRTALHYYLEILKSRPHLITQVKRTIDCLIDTCVVICDEKNETPAHVASKNCRNVELLRRILERQVDLNVKNVGGKTPLNYFIDSELPIEPRGDLIRLFIEKGACLDTSDCRKIIMESPLRDRLFKDVQLCTQAIVNKFYKDLTVLYSLPRATSLPTSMANLQPHRAIELHVEAEINSNGYCLVSKKPVLLTMLCVNSYVNYVQTGCKRRRL